MPATLDPITAPPLPGPTPFVPSPAAALGGSAINDPGANATFQDDSNGNPLYGAANLLLNTYLQAAHQAASGDNAGFDTMRRLTTAPAGQQAPIIDTSNGSNPTNARINASHPLGQALAQLAPGIDAQNKALAAQGNAYLMASLGSQAAQAQANGTPIPGVTAFDASNTPVAPPPPLPQDLASPLPNGVTDEPGAAGIGMIPDYSRIPAPPSQSNGSTMPRGGSRMGAQRTPPQPGDNTPPDHAAPTNDGYAKYAAVQHALYQQQRQIDYRLRVADYNESLHTGKPATGAWRNPNDVSMMDSTKDQMTMVDNRLEAIVAARRGQRAPTPTQIPSDVQARTQSYIDANKNPAYTLPKALSDIVDSFADGLEPLYHSVNVLANPITSDALALKTNIDAIPRNAAEALSAHMSPGQIKDAANKLADIWRNQVNQDQTNEYQHNLEFGPGLGGQNVVEAYSQNMLPSFMQTSVQPEIQQKGLLQFYKDNPASAINDLALVVLHAAPHLPDVQIGRTATPSEVAPPESTALAPSPDAYSPDSEGRWSGGAAGSPPPLTAAEPTSTPPPLTAAEPTSTPPSRTAAEPTSTPPSRTAPQSTPTAPLGDHSDLADMTPSQLGQAFMDAQKQASTGSPANRAAGAERLGAIGDESARRSALPPAVDPPDPAKPPLAPYSDFASQMNAKYGPKWTFRDLDAGDAAEYNRYFDPSESRAAPAVKPDATAKPSEAPSEANAMLAEAEKAAKSNSPEFAQALSEAATEDLRGSLDEIDAAAYPAVHEGITQELARRQAEMDARTTPGSPQIAPQTASEAPQGSDPGFPDNSPRTTAESAPPAADGERVAANGGEGVPATSDVRDQIAPLQARLQELQQTYGDHGQSHPMARNIGALNPAAQEIYNLKGRIASIKGDVADATRRAAGLNEVTPGKLTLDQNKAGNQDFVARTPRGQRTLSVRSASGEGGNKNGKAWLVVENTATVPGYHIWADGVPYKDAVATAKDVLSKDTLPPATDTTPEPAPPAAATEAPPPSPDAPRFAAARARLAAAADKAADDLHAALKAQSTRANSGVDPMIAVHGMRWAANEIANGVLTFADFAEGAVKKFGDDIRPHLAGIWQAAQTHYEDITGEKSPANPDVRLPDNGVGDAASNESETPPTTTTRPVQEHPAPPIKDTDTYAGSINLTKLEGGDDVINAVRAHARENAGAIADRTRGRVSDADAKKAADSMGVSVKHLENLLPGTAFNKEGITAVRDLHNTLAVKLKNAERLFREDPTNEENRLAFESAAAEYNTVHFAVQGLAAEAGRALQAHKMLARAVHVTPTADDLFNNFPREKGAKETTAFRRERSARRTATEPGAGRRAPLTPVKPKPTARPAKIKFVSDDEYTKALREIAAEKGPCEL